MKIEFLISTMNQVDDLFLDRIFQHIPSELVNAIVINQCTNVKSTLSLSRYENIKIFSVKEKGLSRSRNNAILKSNGDVCVVSDDDVIYTIDALEKIKRAFSDENVDVARLQVVTPEGELYKKYSSKEKLNTIRDALGVSSIEVAFRRTSILEKRISFDEVFGLGSIFPSSEDMIFISDCIKRGLRVVFFPFSFVIHPQESSGTDYRSDNARLVVTIGAAFTRIFGLSKAIAVFFVYILKRYKYYKGFFSPLQFFNLLMKGRKEFKEGVK